MKLIKPYTRIRIPFISRELHIPESDVEALLVSLILDSRIHANIDQVNHIIELGNDTVDCVGRLFHGVKSWAIVSQSHLAVNFRFI